MLSVTWMNRIQNKCVVSGCELQSGRWVCSLIYQLEEDQGWLDIFQPPLYRQDGDQVRERYYFEKRNLNQQCTSKQQQQQQQKQQQQQ